MRPWSNSEMREIGRRIADTSDPSRDVPEYGDVLEWYTELAARVQDQIRSLDWSSLLPGPIALASRAKSVDTLRDKLIRDHNTPLQSVQDLAGVRLEASMTLSQQDAVADTIARVFEQDTSAIHDIRLNPRSGYRAVHVWLRLDDGRVEVQVRTRLQGAWANVYELLADRWGREIRYGSLPTDAIERRVVQAFQSLSIKDIANLELEMDRRFLEELRLEELTRFAPDVASDADFESARRMIKDVAEAHDRIHDEFVSRLSDMEKLIAQGRG